MKVIPHPFIYIYLINYINLKKQNITFVGTWTMVYDEGMEIRVNNKHLYVFFKYLPKTPSSNWRHVEGVIY